MLKIYVRKNRNKSYCAITKPNLVDYFTTNNEQTEILKDFSGLKYLPECYLKGNRLWENQSVYVKFRQPLIYELPLNSLWNWVEINENQLYIQNTEFITCSNVLSNIMITPFRQKWRPEFYIKARLKHNKILLYESNDLEKIQDYYNRTYTLDYVDQFRLYNYRRFLFNNRPQIEDPPLLHISEQITKNLFYEIFEIKVNNHKVIYTNEVDGIYNDNLIETIEELRLANHFEAVLYYKNRKYFNWKEKRLENFDHALTLWAKCKLNLAGQILKANYTDGGQSNLERLNNMKTISIDRLPRKCAKIWNPTKAVRFLNEFLNTVKKSVRNDNLTENELNTTEWIFKCSPNFKITVDIVQ